MDTQEDQIKKQEEERKAAEQAQAALRKQMDDDNQKRTEQIQQDQERMRETLERQQEALKQSEEQAEQIRKRAEELNQPKPGEGEDPLAKFQDDMRKSAEQCAKLNEDSLKASKQLEENQRNQERLNGESQKPENANDELMMDVIREQQENLKKSSEELQAQQEKTSKDFDVQSKLFDAKANGFNQSVDDQNKLLDEQQQKLIEDQQKLSSDQMQALGKDLEKHQDHIESMAWDNSHQKGEDGSALPNGQQFEKSLEKTGELNQKLVAEEQKFGLHKPGEIDDQNKPKAGDNGAPAAGEVGQAGEIEDPGKPKTENIHARSDALGEGLPKESKGEFDGRSVIRPKGEEKLGEVQDNWASHEKQQRELIKEIRGHEEDFAKQKEQFDKSISEHGDLSNKKPAAGCTPEELNTFEAQRNHQLELSEKMNKTNQQIERKQGEFQVNEADFQRQSWDRVGQLAKFNGDKDLQEKASLKSAELKEKVEGAKEYLNQEYGPKQENKPTQGTDDYKIVSDGEAKNKHSPVSPAGISPDMVNKADEQVRDIEQARADRLSQESERHDIKHKRN